MTSDLSESAPTASIASNANGSAANGSSAHNEASSTPTKRHEELQYLDLVRDILDNGEHRPDRTGTGTYSIFAPRPLKFSLNEGGRPILPLLTTKRVFLRAVVAELLWFIEGGTSSRALSEAGVRIWDGNGSRAFLDAAGLGHRAEGDLGPVYGFQWRHFGAEYVDARTDYTGRGVDQLADVIYKLRHTPYDRRIILSAWNPADLKKMALPPCHMFAQFYVSYPRQGSNGNNNNNNNTTTTTTTTSSTSTSTSTNGHAAAAAADQQQQQQTQPQGHLHCQLYQRSCDMGLGVPFNIASYALLTHMVAHACGLVPGSLTHVMGDAHVYADHVGALREQLGREPRPFPGLEIRRPRTSEGEGGNGDGVIDGWRAEELVVTDYNPHKSIAMKMSV
ncbi:thymidylate synthase [Xylariaceae sp. FL0804]|nr:thymidylate synthase [Xylariaceae sp. FL0804]